MALIQEIISRRLFNENQKHRNTVLKSEWLARQSQNIMASLLMLSILLQIGLIMNLAFQKAFFSIIVILFLLLPSIQATLVLVARESSAVLISVPTLKICLISHVLIGIIFSLFIIANIEGMIPKAHKVWLTGIDAASLLIQKYIAGPVLADATASTWMPLEELDILYQINLDAQLWIRVAFLKLFFISLILLSFIIALCGILSLLYKKNSHPLSFKASNSKITSKNSVSTPSLSNVNNGPAKFLSENSHTPKLYSPTPYKPSAIPGAKLSPDGYTDISL